MYREYEEFTAGEAGLVAAAVSHPVLRPLLERNVLWRRCGLVRVRYTTLEELREHELVPTRRGEFASYPGGTYGTWLWALIGDEWRQLNGDAYLRRPVREALNSVPNSATAAVFITAINAMMGEHAIPFGGVICESPDLYNIEIWEPLN